VPEPVNFKQNNQHLERRKMDFFKGRRIKNRWNFRTREFRWLSFARSNAVRIKKGFLSGGGSVLGNGVLAPLPFMVDTENRYKYPVSVSGLGKGLMKMPWDTVTVASTVTHSMPLSSVCFAFLFADHGVAAQTHILGLSPTRGRTFIVVNALSGIFPIVVTMNSEEGQLDTPVNLFTDLKTGIPGSFVYDLDGNLSGAIFAVSQKNQREFYGVPISSILKEFKQPVQAVAGDKEKRE
jgi:hypothetical protein